MKSARLIVDEGNSTADHGHNKDGHGNRSREQILDVLDVRINFDNLEVNQRIEPRRGHRQALPRLEGVQTLIEILDERLHSGEKFAGDKIVRVVFNEGDARAVSL